MSRAWMSWPSARRTCSRHHTRARRPRCLFKATRLVAQDAFHQLDARHRCQAGLARVGWFRFRSLARHPFARGAPALPSRKAADPCYPAPPSPPSRALPAILGKMSLTDFCNRSTTRAPTEPLDSPPAAPRGALGAGGDPVDAVPPASAALPTFSFRQHASMQARRRAPDFRTGAAPRPAFSTAPDARSSTSDAPCHGPDHPAPGGASRTAKGHRLSNLVKGRCTDDPERLLSPVSPRRLLAQVSGDPVDVCNHHGS